MSSPNTKLITAKYLTFYHLPSSVIIHKKDAKKNQQNNKEKILFLLTAYWERNSLIRSLNAIIKHNRLYIIYPNLKWKTK